MNTSQVGPVQPWWRIGIWWLALGGPLLVALASFVTLFFALRGGDPALSTAAVQSPARDAATTPAVQARNHAATPRP
jgi:uncharacterized protein